MTRIRIALAMLLAAICIVRLILWPSGWALTIGILALILAGTLVVKDGSRPSGV